MENELVEMNSAEFSEKLKIVFDEILKFKSPFENLNENESYLKLINKVKELFPAVIAVTKELEGKVKLEYGFNDEMCKINANNLISDYYAEVEYFYTGVNNFIDHKYNSLRLKVNLYQTEKSSSIYLKEMKNRAEKSDEYFRKICEVIEQSETLYTEHALKGFKTLYNGISKSQKTFSKNWLIGAFVFGGLLLISVLCCFLINSKIWSLIDYTNETNYIFIFANEISFNLVLLAAFFWCARMYSINKALEINYKHKSVSSDALLSFVEAIKNDDKTKNSILLEAARMIFAPPETGLTSKGDKLNMKLLDTIRDISPVNNDNSNK